jgi:L-2-hydroxyglutarate oxidase
VNGTDLGGADVCVVGAGIVGLATARAIQSRHSGARVVVLERGDRIASHQSGHSSGVIHAGIYYPPGSLKARLCVEGAARLYEYCAERGIDARRDGKVIVATRESELSRLDELEGRGRANGVPGLARIGPDELREIEPHAAGIDALHSPNTGVVDFPAVAASLAAEVRRDGGEVITGCEVVGLRPGGGRIAIEHATGRSMPAEPCSARGRGRTGWRCWPVRVPTRGSCPFAAPTSACGQGARTWSARTSTPFPTPTSHSSGCT